MLKNFQQELLLISNAVNKMFLFKKIFSAAAGIFLLFSVSAGELAELSRELDYIEYSFAFAAMQPATSPNRQSVEKRLLNFNTRLSNFYVTLTRKKIPGIPNFPKPAATMLRVFNTLANSTGYSRLPRYKGTSLGHYSKAYNEYLRDLSRLDTSKKKRSNRTPPTLKTLPLTNYQAWLERTAQTYIQSLRRTVKSRGTTRSSSKRKKSSRNDLSTHTVNQLEEYIVSVTQLRYCFALIAQNKLYKE